MPSPLAIVASLAMLMGSVAGLAQPERGLLALSLIAYRPVARMRFVISRMLRHGVATNLSLCDTSQPWYLIR